MENGGLSGMNVLRFFMKYVASSITAVVLLTACGLSAIDTIEQSPTRQPTTEQTSEAQPELAVVPTIEDVEIKVKERSKSCFGSAGCNIEYKLELDVEHCNPDDSYDIQYRIVGSEDEKMDTISVAACQFMNEQGYAQTANTSVKLRAKILSVELV